MIVSRLRIVIAEYEVKTGKRLPIKRLAQETGLAESTLHSLANNATQRFDAPVLESLCQYFGIQISELLIYDPSEDGTMTVTMPSTGEEAINNLVKHFPDILMQIDKSIFTSHEFILKLAQKHQQEYVAALTKYIESDAPFRDVNGQLAKRLKEFADLESKGESSENIFDNPSRSATWKKHSY
ncbi:MAG: helix-turn-helix transcriptional regulator [Anaerolineae bacterium]